MVLVSMLGAGHLTQAASLDPQVLAQVRAATFEVVAAKPVIDNLTYVRPLPLDLLPFQERNDKYYSIGTAFAIGGNRYITAAHVLDIGIGSLWGAPALRDAKGQVYSLDKIEKFSLTRDFVVFSVTGHPENATLKTNITPELNGVVYAVGNALGTGVIVRDGLLTSTTPEEQDGRWNWLRFSAAASPGNSGGPLLNQDGEVIGIVLRKSPNENLNFALPIDEALRAPERVADFDNRAPYQLDILDTIQHGTLKTQLTLPLGFSEFNAAVVKIMNGFLDSQLRDLLSKEPDKVFPNGPGSIRLLHSVAKMQVFPSVIARKRDGEWAIADTKGSKTVLPANGYVVAGTFGRELLFRLHKSDDVSSAALYGDAEGFIKQLLSSGFMQRPVGAEKVQVTDMGKPIEDMAHVDAWQRRWQVRVWPLPFANQMFVTVSLPVPDGYVTLARYTPASRSHDGQISLEALTDFVCAGYSGTLAQWKDFMKNAALLPTGLKTLKIDYDYDRRFSFESQRVSFSFTQELQAIGRDSVLSLGFDYLGGDGTVGWNIGDVRVSRNADESGGWINIQRHVAPSEELDDTFKASWNKLVEGTHPYDGVSHTEGDVTKITGKVESTHSSAPNVLYTAFVGVPGNVSQDAMKPKLDALLKNVRVEERSPQTVTSRSMGGS